jgi:hypothetical protein
MLSICTYCECNPCAIGCNRKNFIQQDLDYENKKRVMYNNLQTALKNSKEGCVYCECNPCTLGCNRKNFIQQELDYENKKSIMHSNLQTALTNSKEDCVYCECNPCTPDCVKKLFAQQDTDYVREKQHDAKTLQETLKRSVASLPHIPAALRSVITFQRTAGLTATGTCPSCTTVFGCPIGMNQSEKLQPFDTTSSDGLVAWMSGGCVDAAGMSFGACATVQCGGASGFTMTSGQADMATTQFLYGPIGYFVEGCDEKTLHTVDARLKFLQVMFTGRIKFQKGDQIPQHLTVAGRNLLGINCPPFRLMLNDAEPHAIQILE